MVDASCGWKKNTQLMQQHAMKLSPFFFFFSYFVQIQWVIQIHQSSTITNINKNSATTQNLNTKFLHGKSCNEKRKITVFHYRIMGSKQMLRATKNIMNNNTKLFIVRNDIPNFHPNQSWNNLPNFDLKLTGLVEKFQISEISFCLSLKLISY